MPPPSPNSQPRFAVGCRWGSHGGQPVVLFPEGMIRVQGTGQSILELCDGHRTIEDIVTVLSAKYENAEPQAIGVDVAKFLEALQQKRIVDY